MLKKYKNIYSGDIYCRWLCDDNRKQKQKQKQKNKNKKTKKKTKQNKKKKTERFSSIRIIEFFP